MIVEVGGPLIVAAVLAGLGRWGWRNADRSVPTTMSPRDRAHRVTVLRRGSVTCLVMAAVFVAVAAAGFFL